jgi:hypothetical protein
MKKPKHLISLPYTVHLNNKFFLTVAGSDTRALHMHVCLGPKKLWMAYSQRYGESGGEGRVGEGVCKVG